MISVFENIFLGLPVYCQNKLISEYGRRLWHKRYGADLQKILAEINRVNNLSESELFEFRLQKLKTMLNYANEEIPYYSSLFAKNNIHPNSFSTIEDLQKIPPLEKEVFRTQFKKFLPKNYKKNIYFSQKTSGSTGTPLTVYVDKDTYRLAMALLVHHEEQHGVKFGAPRATFAGRMLQKFNDMSPPFWRYNNAENQMLFSSYHLNEETIRYYWEALNQFKPKEIIGYPSAIYSFAILARDKCGPPEFEPNIVVSNSETLLEWQREEIENYFNCSVVDYYGTSEYVIFAGQCIHKKYHISPLLGIAEVVDGNAKSIVGEPGEMLCTTLSNFVTPLIRYKIGDLATMSSTLCNCGYRTQVLERVEGRVDDVIMTMDGRAIGRIDHIFKGVAGIKECQIIQETVKNITLRVVKGSDYSEKDMDIVILNLKSRVGKDIIIKIEFCEFIKRTSRGKFKAVINRMSVV